jgi:hypothetical protein
MTRWAMTVDRSSFRRKVTPEDCHPGPESGSETPNWTPAFAGVTDRATP